MPTEGQIQGLAYSIWEQEGRPEGKDIEHYHRAKRLLEEQEHQKIIELGAAPKIIELGKAPAVKRRGRKKKDTAK